MFYCYVLKSATSGRLYIGQTNDVAARLERHNSGLNVSTRNKGPWELVHHFKFETRVEAVSMESKLKKFKNRDRIMAFIERDKSSSAG